MGHYMNPDNDIMDDQLREIEEGLEFAQLIGLLDD